MKIKISIISVIFCLMMITTVAQISNIVNLKGIVLDANTEARLTFAHISIKNKTVGTITNENGEFTFMFDDNLSKDSLIVSFIGYEQFIMRISEIKHQELSVKLKPKTLKLEEIVVNQYSAENLVKKAISKIPFNYWGKPIILRAFYRETIKENQRFTEYAEGVIDIYKNPYGSDNKDQVRLIKGRRKNDLSAYQVSKKAVVTIGGPVYCNYYDRIRYPLSFLDTTQLKLYDFKFGNPVTYNGQAAYVISFDQKEGLKKSLRKGKLLIEPDTYTILRIEYGYSPKGMKYELPGPAIRGILKLLAGMSIEDVKLRVVADYQYVNNYWCLKSIYYKNEQVIAKKKNRKYVITVQKNLIVNQITDKNLIPFTASESLSSKEFKKQLGDYDEDFWAGYNYLKAPEEMLEIVNKVNNNN